MMKKRICYFLLSAAVLTGMVGCGTGNHKKNTEAESAGETTVQVAESTSEEETDGETETAATEVPQGTEAAEGTAETGTQEPSDSTEETEAASNISRINYYDPEGKLIYYDSYAYYDNGLLCSTTLHSVEYFSDGESYTGDIYTVLFLYDDEGNIERTVLDALTISDWYDEASGKIILDYDYDEDGNSSEKCIYPASESIEQEKFGVDSSKTEVVRGTAPVISTNTDSGWADTYLREIFSGDEPTDQTEGRFIYVNEDSDPELWMDYGYGYAGGEVFTAKDGMTDKVYISHGMATCLEKRNLMLTSGGHMDGYADTVYQIEDGKFIPLAEGSYGAGGGDDIQTDENGELIYHYYWNQTEVAQEEYRQKLEDAFDSKKATDMEQNVYTYQQCKLLLQKISEISK